MCLSSWTLHWAGESCYSLANFYEALRVQSKEKKIISDQRSNRELKCWLITHSTHYQKLLLYANKHFMYLNLAKSNHRRQQGAEGGKNHKASISIKLLEQPEWINPSMDWLWAPMGYTSASLRSGALSFVSAVYSPQSSTQRPCQPSVAHDANGTIRMDEWLTPCLGFFVCLFVAMMKFHDKMENWREKDLFCLHFHITIHWRKSGQ